MSGDVTDPRPVAKFITLGRLGRKGALEAGRSRLDRGSELELGCCDDAPDADFHVLRIDLRTLPFSFSFSLSGNGGGGDGGRGEYRAEGVRRTGYGDS